VTPVRRGDRVELLDLPAGYEQYGLTAGERGVVDFIDSLSTIHIRWDSGRRVGVTKDNAGLIRVAGPADDAAGSERQPRH
jgi:hypothetical protein